MIPHGHNALRLPTYHPASCFSLRRTAAISRQSSESDPSERYPQAPARQPPECGAGGPEPESLKVVGKGMAIGVGEGGRVGPTLRYAPHKQKGIIIKL
eukprot:4859533-Pleurochrysis_carterae.AAC.7